MDQPGLKPPEGEVSNFDNPDRRMYYICIASNVVAIVVCTVFVFLRFLARYRLATKIALDDVACLLGYLGYMGNSGLCLLMLRYGGGLHQWDVRAPLVPYYHKVVYATMVNYGPMAFLTKAAILLFLTRVFSPFQSYCRWIYAFIGLMALYYIVMLLLKIFICVPISMFWGATTEGRCFNQRILILVDNVISLVSDMAVLLLPCPLTRTLQVGLKSKIKVGLVFGIGGIACIFSLFRLVLIANHGESPDSTYRFVQINLTGVAECGIGIVCACFPLLPSLWNNILGKNKTGYSGSNTKSQYEMMSSQHKYMRSTTNRNNAPDVHTSELDNDENNLIAPRRAFVTVNIQAGDDSSRASSDNKRKDPSVEDSRIVRTVEVYQYKEP